MNSLCLSNYVVLPKVCVCVCVCLCVCVWVCDLIEFFCPCVCDLMESLLLSTNSWIFPIIIIGRTFSLQTNSKLAFVPQACLTGYVFSGCSNFMPSICVCCSLVPTGFYFLS